MKYIIILGVNMNKNISITACLNKVKIGDIESNYRSIIKLIKDNKKSELLVFPLLSLSGYSCGELFNQKEYLDQIKKYLLKIVKEVSNTVTLSIPLEYLERKYICNIVISNKKILGVVPKICFNNYERNFFSGGKEIINKKIKLDSDVDFSYDLNFIENKSEVSFSFNTLNSDVLLVPACDKTTLKSNDNIDKIYKEVSKYSSVVYLNSSNDTSTNFIIVPRVAIYENTSLVVSRLFDNCEVSHNLNLKIDSTKNEKEALPLDNIVNKLSKLENCKLDNTNSKFPFIEEYKSKLLDIIPLQARTIITRARNTNIYNMVIGVSGGLDSTLALLALYEARKIEKKIKIYGFTLPYKGNTSTITKSNALELLTLLKCDYIEEIDISKQVNQHLEDIKHNKEDVVYENVQARVRTLILMSIANRNQGMVIGTGDLSESALGWCTYNGDHMAMYNINSTIPKTLIKKVVEEYSLTSNKEIQKVLHSIVNTPISPELRKSDDGKVSQKTEEQIGKYEINDFILYYTLKYKIDLNTMYNLIHKSFNQLSKKEIKDAMINFYSRFFSQQFKRNCSPEGATITEFSLSPDKLSLPSDIDYSFIIDLIKKL